MKRLEKAFFLRDVLEVAPDLVGKLIVRETPEGRICLRIAETEAYRGVEDTACHAHKGRTPRTETLYMEGGTIYVYLCYGIHWLLNIVTGHAEIPQAVLIRACFDAYGPGKLTKALNIDKHFNGKLIDNCDGLWLADDGKRPRIRTANRVGIDYAAPEDQARLWRYVYER